MIGRCLTCPEGPRSEAYDQLMTEFESVKRNNKYVKGELKIAKREAEYWEIQAKTLLIRKEKLEVELKLCMGTGL
jgi:hypothetical protein